MNSLERFRMTNKIESFQALRAIAIFMIFLSHCNSLWIADGVNKLDCLGAPGVSLFIILSGFLTAYSYDWSSKAVPLKNRLKKKINKFYILHVGTLIIAIPFTISLLEENSALWSEAFLANVSLIQAFIPLKQIYFSFNAVSWYLSLTFFSR